MRWGAEQVKMNKLIIIKKSDFSISQTASVFYGEQDAMGLVINPFYGAKQSGEFELGFMIKSTDKSIPYISEEFCLVSRAVINLTEQHAFEKEATLSRNSSVQNPQKPIKENSFFIELKGENG